MIYYIFTIYLYIYIYIYIYISILYIYSILVYFCVYSIYPNIHYIGTWFKLGAIFKKAT